jgi:hypothetical protein
MTSDWRNHPLDTYVIDFDGTLITEHWPHDEDLSICTPLLGNIQKVWEIKDAGHNIEIFTSRPSWHRNHIERWLSEHNVPFDRVTFGKPIGIKYIDNKAVHSEEESWL